MNDLPPLVDQGEDNKKTVLILLLIMGVICLFTLGAVSIAFYTLNTVKQEQKSRLATEQASITATAVSATNTAVYQATQVAEYEFFDDFDDNENEWDFGQEDSEYWRGSIGVRDGLYIWDVKEIYESDYEYVYSWRSYWDNKSVADFDLSVDARLATPNAQRLCYAVIFHASPNGFSDGGYEFYICDDQQFFVGYYSGDTKGEPRVFSNWTHSDAIRSGDWNTLAVNARGDHFILSINNAVVSEFTDSSRRSGYVYLMIISFDRTPGTIMFDNFGLQRR